MNRRDILKGAAGSMVLLGALPYIGLRNGFAQGVRITESGIDIHCHIFNAADLPIREFVRKVYFNVYDPQTSPPTRNCPNVEYTPPSWLGRKAAEAAADLCERIAGSAPTVADELKWMNELRTGSADDAVGEDDDEDSTILTDFFSSNRATGSGEDADGSTADGEEEEKDRLSREGRRELEDYILDEIGYPKRNRAGVGSSADDADEESVFSDPEESKKILQKLCKGNGYFSNFICWIRLLKTFRFALAQRIERDYQNQAGNDVEFKLYTPALIDYSKWLQNEPKSSLSEQMQVMEQIAIRSGKVKFHGYMAYDPLRDVHEDGAALSLAQKAVTDHGFVGVKTYPPMGFKPYNNSGDTTITFPLHALKNANGGALTDSAGNKIDEPKLRELLDVRLGRLYEWCASQQVPILTHATRSYGSGPGYACRAQPSNWGGAIDKYPKLRVCLGHFGDFGEASNEDGRWKGKFPERIEQTWEWQFGELVTAHPNSTSIFADVSYYSELIKGARSWRKDLLRDALVEVLKKHQTAADRLVYGSDWLLLALEKRYAEHVRAVREFMTKVFDEVDPALTSVRLRGLFRDNAIRFLGLKNGEKAWERLDKFYSAHNLNKAFLNSF